MNNCKPVFVYGTLKKKYSSYLFMDMDIDFHRTEEQIHGDLYALSGASFPALGSIETNNIVTGELVYINKDYLYLFDRIESEGILYNRIVTKTLSGIECYVYQWANLSELISDLLIENGNYEQKFYLSTLFIPLKELSDNVFYAFFPQYNLVTEVCAT